MARSSRLSRRPVEAPPWRSAIFGAAIGLAMAAVWYAPASWLSAAVKQATSGRGQLIEVDGTVWTGSGRLLLTGGDGSRDRSVLPGHVHWKLRPDGWALALQLSADCCTPQPLRARIQPRWGGATLHIADGASEWPVPVLAGLGTPWNTVLAEGSLRLTTQAITVEWLARQPVLAGLAELTAINLTTSLTTLKPMGSYRLTVTGGPRVELTLATLDGSLQLNGSGRWIGSRLHFEGVASASPKDEAALSNLLNIIGRRNGLRSIITLG